MQFFKLLALVPVAASLVAATGLPVGGGLYQAQNELSKVQQSGKGLESLNSGVGSLGSLLRRHNKRCDTSQITELKSLIEVNLDMSVTIDVVAELCDKTWKKVNEYSTDVETSVDVKVWTSILVDLRLTLEASLSVYSELQAKGNSCQWGELQKHSKVILDLYTRINVVLDAYAKLDLSIQTQLKAQFESLSTVFTNYTKTCASVIVGLEADIHAHVEAIICLLDQIRVQLSVDFSAQIGGLLSIGA